MGEVTYPCCDCCKLDIEADDHHLPHDEPCETCSKPLTHEEEIQRWARDYLVLDEERQSLRRQLAEAQRQLKAVRDGWEAAESEVDRLADRARKAEQFISNIEENIRNDAKIRGDLEERTVAACASKVNRMVIDYWIARKGT